ncbi:MAG: polysaccharide deacetylase family protein [Bacteroidales bacterium]|jgi:peptidoglycan/xylan/chitin deacetylase (PgdA/CDA1 family)|nr:polysaccharide deacetylase family protein [Bacteroidales bacterium]
MTGYFTVFMLCTALVVFVWIFRKDSRSLCVLMYHHVGVATREDEAAFFVSADMFRQQIDLLLSSHFHIVSLREVERAYQTGQRLPPHSVLLTLDDGWLDNYTQAFPVVKEKKVPVTIFLSVALTGVEKDLLTWQQVHEMHESGWVQFASHGAHHRRLRNLSDAEIIEELAISRNVLTKALGTEVLSFCYPYGAFDRRVRQLVFQTGYIMDFGTRKGINRLPWKAHQPLRRAHVMAGESLSDFYRQLHTGYKRSIRCAGKYPDRLFSA